MHTYDTQFVSCCCQWGHLLVTLQTKQTKDNSEKTATSYIHLLFKLCPQNCVIQFLIHNELNVICGNKYYLFGKKCASVVPTFHTPNGVQRKAAQKAHTVQGHARNHIFSSEYCTGCLLHKVYAITTACSRRKKYNKHSNIYLLYFGSHRKIINIVCL